MNNNFLQKKKKAFALVDVILGAALFSIIVIFTVPAFLYGQESAMLEGKRQRATDFSLAGLEVVRNIRDNNFNNLSIGTFGLNKTINGWILSGSSDTDGELTRRITIENIDENRRLVKSRVTWPQNMQRNGEIILETILTNFSKEMPQEPGEATYSVNIYNDWMTGYCAEVLVETESEEEIEWEVQIDLSNEPLNGTVDSLWSGTWSFNAPILTVSGPDWSKTISATNPYTFNFCANRPSRPITILATVSNPADNGNKQGPTTEIVPPSDLQVGDFIVMFAMYRGNANLNILNTGGQDWQAFNQLNRSNALRTRIFFAIYNGTWQGNPSVSVGSGTAALSVVAHFFRYTDPWWAIDTWETSGNFNANSNPYNVEINSLNTNSNGAMTLAFWASEKSSTWGLQSLDWANIGNSQYRNTRTASSISSAYKTIETPGPSGNVINRILTNTNVRGNWHIFSIKKMP